MINGRALRLVELEIERREEEEFKARLYKMGDRELRDLKQSIEEDSRRSEVSWKWKEEFINKMDEGKTYIGGMMGYMLQRAWYESMEENRMLMEKLMAKKIIEEDFLA